MGSSSSKPPSLPNHWPYPDDKDLRERPKRCINILSAQNWTFCDNFIKTSKYEIWNFIPKFLLEEFNPRTKFANCYFLLIASLQCIPAISNTGGYPTVLIPLVFVVTIDAIFQILEDIARHRADKEANASFALVFDTKLRKFSNKKWFEIQVGDFIKVESRDIIPADILIVACSEKPDAPPQGKCYVETKSLDGETNLKLRQALPNSYGEIRSDEDLAKLQGKIEMEHPNNLISSFAGVIDFQLFGREAVQPNNVLLRGCVLRNTDYVYGIVVNTGHDTKIMMSSTSTKSKTSLLESLASTQIQRIIILLGIVCAAGATGQSIWNAYNHVHRIPYLDWHPDAGSNWIVAFFYFFLLHATFIPVSLYVSMALARFFQSYFMNSDLSMYYERTDTPCNVRTMTLNEELGQISYIFSDKTGTLTCNILDFRKMSINGVSYGLGMTEIGKASWKLQGKEIPAEVLEGERMAQLNSVEKVSFYDPNFVKRNVEKDEKSHIDRFFRILAVCHDVIPERIDGKIKLSASNPDDEALVSAAKYFGFEFRDRKMKIAVVHNTKTKQDEEYEILESIGFTSKRKRMSVIFRDNQNKIWIYTKGADTVMYDRLRAKQEGIIAKTVEHLDIYGTEGLRCLLIGYAEIPDANFKQWMIKYKSATTDLKEIENLKNGLANQIELLQDDIESKLILAGCTGIEDKLQDGVPETIADLAKAGLNIWVLTGDKEETAINIAVACNLVQPPPYMVQVIINKKIASDKQSIVNKLLEAGIDFDANFQVPRALIIDGPTLITALADEETKKVLYTFAQRCRAVVCCRVSPDQKKEMVNMIRVNLPHVRTLSVGDGANDVAMIQAAHIGVGIKGEEGVQAVNASDFAIAQFKYLSPLLLKHGRYNYIRMSNLVCYMFYKNVLMSMGQWWFNFFDGFSGQKYYTEGGIQLFNMMFTSLPIVMYAVYDRDIVYYTKLFPQLYQIGMKNEMFTSTVFWTWILHALTESVLVSLMPIGLLRNSEPGYGLYNTFWEAGALTLTAVIVIVNFQMFFIQNRWYGMSLLILFLSIASWFAIAALINVVIAVDFDFYGVWSHLLANGSFWLGLLLMVTIVIGKYILIHGIKQMKFQTNQQVLYRREVDSGISNATNTAPTLTSVMSSGFIEQHQTSFSQKMTVKNDAISKPEVAMVKITNK